MFPIGIFGAAEKHLFEPSNRVHPVYFEFLSQDVDDIAIEVPPGWQVGSLPKALNQDLRVVGYSSTAENTNGTLHLTRKLAINIINLDVKYYSPLRSFFQIVKAGDDQQIALLPGSSVSSN